MPALGDMLHLTSLPLVVCILAGAVACGRAGGGSVRNRLMLGAAALAAVAVMVGPVDWIAERRLLSVHMAQHIVLFSFVPTLALAAMPGPTLEAVARRLGGLLRSPIVCLVAGVLVIWTLHVPPILEAGLRYGWLGDLQHVALIAAGLLLAWPLIGPARIGGFQAAASLFAAEIGIGALGVLLAWYPHIIYSPYAQAPRMWGLSAATDQSAAGAVLLVVEEPLLAIEFAIVFIRGLGENEE